VDDRWVGSGLARAAAGTRLSSVLLRASTDGARARRLARASCAEQRGCTSVERRRVLWWCGRTGACGRRRRAIQKEEPAVLGAPDATAMEARGGDPPSLPSQGRWRRVTGGSRHGASRGVTRRRAAGLRRARMRAAMRHEDARLVVGCMDGAGGDADDGDSRGARGRSCSVCPRPALLCVAPVSHRTHCAFVRRRGAGAGRAARRVALGGGGRCVSWVCLATGIAGHR